MAETTHHIISGCKWQTSFDDKDEAVRLQDRLSDWSEVHLPRELAAVFNAVCPPDQTWRIESLEVDLGEIDYSDLEHELSKRFQSRLKEKLSNLLLYAGRGSNDIEIVNEQVSQEQLISSFLLYGYLPWACDSTTISINDVLTTQLQNNRQHTILILKDLAANYENVRKRLAWQVSENIIARFVRVVETSNSVCILSFADALTTIQQKETIIQTGTNNFRKNLWLWILNYLFTERGTIFNKVSYLKSSLRQMSDHYNIGYADILAMISRAARQVSHIKSDFLSTLELLVQDYNSSSSTNRDRRKKLPHMQQTIPIAPKGPTRENHAAVNNGLQEWLSIAAERDQLESIIIDLICKQQVPAWLNNHAEDELLMAISTYYPEQLTPVLKQCTHIPWLSTLLPFHQLIQCIKNTRPQYLSILNTLEKLHTELGTTNPAMQHILAEKVVQAWISNNLQYMTTQQFLDSLSLQKVLPGVAKAAVPGKKTPAEIKKNMPVKNAGLVLVSSYIPLLFQRLNITAQPGASAVHYLQYIVTGHCKTEEHLLILNKLLCGMPLHDPIPDETDMPEADKKLINEMLQAIIGYWSAIGSCSIDGFRGNWLVRDGLLTEYADKWELTVEKRAYDILMNKSPFSFSIIKYPWMPKPLHVNWPY